MKKIPTTLLILLAGLIFNNAAFALFNKDQYRCKMEYTQLDVLTGTEKAYKDTTQFDVTDDYCAKGTGNLKTKLLIWMYEKPTNIIVHLNEVMCKRRSGGIFSDNWSGYKDCIADDDRIGYKQEIADYLSSVRPLQVNNSLKYPADYP
jgi:hypothetical protein